MMDWKRSSYGICQLYQRGDQGDPGAGSGYQVEYGSISLSYLSCNSEIPVCSPAVSERPLFLGQMDLIADSEKDRD